MTKRQKYVIDLFEEGMDKDEIARVAGIARSTVDRYLHPVIARRRFVTAVVVEQFLQLRTAGLDYYQISSATGFSTATVSEYINKSMRGTLTTAKRDHEVRLNPEDHPEFGRINRILMTRMSRWGSVL